MGEGNVRWLTPQEVRHAKGKKAWPWAAIALLVLGSLVGPGAVALTWDGTVAVENPVGAGGATPTYSPIIAFTPTTWVVGYHYKTADDFKVGKTTSTGASYSTAAIDTTGALGAPIDGAKPLTSTQDGYFCYLDSTNAENKIASTHDQGLSWGIAPVTTATSSTGCGVWAIDSTTVGVVSYDFVALSYSFYLSTDGGGSFAAPVTITTVTAGGAIAVGWKDADNAVVVVSTTATTFKSCATDDQGATWTCGSTIPGATVRPNRVRYLGTGDSYVWDHFTSGAFKVYKTTNAGALWSQLPGPAISGIGTVASNPISTMVVSDVDSWGAFFGFCQSVEYNGGSIITGIYTADGGATWTAEETVYSGPSVTPGIVCTQSGTLDSTLTTEVRVIVSCGCHWSVSGNENPAVFTNDALFSDASTAIGASATVATTNLVGYDVNPLGTTVVARTDGGQFVRVYDAGTLTEAADDFDTDCTRSDGVFSAYQGDLIGFIDCDALADPTDLIIRTSAMQVPTFPNCDSGTDVVSLSGFSSAGGDNAGQLGQVKDYPIDQSNTNTLLGFDRCQVAWGFSSLAGSGSAVGKIGMDLWTNREADADFRETEEVQFGSFNTNDFCVGLDPTSDYYLAAVQSSSSTKIYPVDLFFDQDLDGHLSGTIGTPALTSSAYNGAYGVACGQENVAIQAALSVVLVDATTGQQVWTSSIPVTSSDTRGIAVSKSFKLDGTDCTWGAAGCKQYVAYKDSGTIVIVDGSTATPTQTGTIEVPTGTWRGMVMDETGQNLWVFTSTQINRYEIIEATTVVPVGPQSGIPPVEDGDDNLFNIDENTIPGVGSFGANLIFGAILMGLVSFGVGSGGGYVLEENRGRAFRWNWPAAGVGAVVGFLMAWGFGFFATEVVVAFVILAAIVLGLYLFGRD